MKLDNLVSASALVLAASFAVPAHAQIFGNSSPSGYQSAFFATYIPFAANKLEYPNLFPEGRELWKLDPGGLTVSHVANIYNGPESSFPDEFVYLSGTDAWLFVATDLLCGRELWKTDGNTATPVANIEPLGGSSNPAQLTVVGTTVFFTAKTTATGRELWQTDGVTTTLVLNINTNGGLGGPDSSDPREFVEFGGQLYFTANDGSGRDIWRTNGTTTVKVSSGLVNPTGLTAGVGKLFFAATSSGDRELYHSNGTTHLPFSINNSGSSNPTNITSAGLVYFVADDGSHGRELHMSNGTVTAMVDDINTSGNADVDDITQGPILTEAWFVADDGTNGRQVYKTTGTGATMVTNGPSVLPRDLQHVAFTNKVVFRGFDGDKPPACTGTGNEIYVSDGTLGPATLLKDIYPGCRDSEVQGLRTITNLAGAGNFGALFIADDGDCGIELWRTQGTLATTTMVWDIAAQPTSKQPTIESHVDTGTGTVDVCLEGNPGALAAIGFDFAPVTSPAIGGVVGTYQLGATPIVFTVILDANGFACVNIPIPNYSIDILAQGVMLDGSTILLSDLTAIGIVSITVTEFNGGLVMSYGAYNDDNHLYEVIVDLPGPTHMPESGAFWFYNVDRDKYEPCPVLEYTNNNVLQIHLGENGASQVPSDWDKTQIELHFIQNDSAGTTTVVWRSYC